MGVILTPPAPYLSADTIQPFDAVASQLEDVFPTPPDFPPTNTNASASWLPVAPASPPDPDPAAPWKAVQALWETPAIANGAVNTVSAWATLMGWNTSTNSASSASGGAITTSSASGNTPAARPGQGTLTVTGRTRFPPRKAARVKSPVAAAANSATSTSGTIQGTPPQLLITNLQSLYVAAPLVGATPVAAAA